ncbi:MAG: Ig-like domain-containing protein [Nitrospira sp.]|nr:Ig-like domain-containing protein [Nitrospira sp.]
MRAPRTWTFTTGTAPDTTDPIVIGTSPSSGATNVATTSALTVTFSEPIDPSSVTTETFSVRAGPNPPITGTLSVNGATVTFTPSPGAPLDFNTSFTVTLTTGIRDLARNTLQTNYIWTFTTGVAPDTTSPTVTTTTPVDGATNVPIAATIMGTFDEPLAPASVTATTFTLKDGANNQIPGNITVNGSTAVFSLLPGSLMNYATNYTATLTTGVKDLAGNPIQSSYTWSFTTMNVPDTIPPSVTSTMPFNGASNASTIAPIVATFSESISQSSVTTNSFTIRDTGNNLVTGSLAVNGTDVSFTPASGRPLANNMTYTVSLTTGIKDQSGNTLQAPYSWSFSTGPTTPTQTTGLDWPGDGSVRRMLYWHNPFPIYDATYIFKVYPRKKTTGPARYYTTFFWGNDGNFTWDRGNANTFYGAHPYPVPASTGPGQWEISVYGYDFVTGTEVDWNRWHTQAFRAWRESSSLTHHEFYYDWPDTSKKISYTVNDPSWAKVNPPTPAIVMGQAPNLNGVSWGGYPGWEEFNGVIRGIQIYSGLLSLGDIQSEIDQPQSTTAGQNLIWYLNVNPTPTDPMDKSGRGHHPSWDGTGRPSLYTAP